MAVESQAWRAGRPSLHQASRPQASRPPGLHQASRPSGLPQASKPSGLHQQATSGLRQPATGPPPIGGKLSATRATKPASKKRPSAPAAKSMPVAKRHKAGALGCQSLVFIVCVARCMKLIQMMILQLVRRPLPCPCACLPSMPG